MAQVIVALWKWWLSLFTYKTVFAWFVGCAVAAFAILSYQASKPPATFESVQEDDGIVTKNGRALILYHNRKRTNCSNSVSRWIYSADVPFNVGDGPAMEPVTTSSSPPVPLGDVRFGIVFHMPEGSPFGDYMYQTRTQYYYPCNLLHPTPVNSVPVRFSYVAGDLGAPPKIILANPNEAVEIIPGNSK